MKKPLAALIIAQMKKKPKSEESAMESEDSMDDASEEGLVASAEEIISAVKGGDAESLVEALKAFVEQC